MPGERVDWWVVCLCAGWCGVCRDWRPLFDEAARAHPGVRFSWVDIEDEAEAMGDVDVETFPTILVANAGKVRFLGPVQPSVAQLARLIASLQAEAAPADCEESAHALWERLAVHLLPSTAQ